MAIAVLESPVAELHGALERKGIINRQKKYRDERGRVIREDRQEAYKVKNLPAALSLIRRHLLTPLPNLPNATPSSPTSSAP